MSAVPQQSRVKRCASAVFIAAVIAASASGSYLFIQECGWRAYFSALPLILISITMLVRANDLGWRPGALWMFRRLGFIMAGFAPFAIIYADWEAKGANTSLYESLFRVGIALVFLTTPYLPPWWKWAFGGAPADHDNPVWSDDARGLPK